MGHFLLLRNILTNDTNDTDSFDRMLGEDSESI